MSTAELDQADDIAYSESAADDPQLPENSQTPVSEIQKPRDYCDVLKSHPELRPQVIYGICRMGETVNIIAAPKIGKSFLAVFLAWCVALGRPWLGFQTRAGKVLIIDDECHEETIADRIDNVANALMIPTDERRGKIDTIILRGKELVDIDLLGVHLNGIAAGTYSIVILDALYRLMPPNVSENDNAAMTRIYNTIDRYAARMKACFFVVHHTSKGDQSTKGVTDVGSGAGAISRAADSHLTIRPHAMDGHAVLEAVTRSFKSPEPLSIKFEYPLWHATTLEPAKLTARAANSEDEKLVAIVIDFLKGQKRRQQNLVFEQMPCGIPKAKRIIARLLSEGKITVRRHRKKGGKKEYVFYALAESSGESNSESNSSENREISYAE